MDNSFLAYIQQLELMFFFSAYPLIYMAVVMIAGKPVTENSPERMSVKKRFILVLPFAYALVGTLYTGFVLKNLYPDYSVNNIRMSVHQPLLMTWGMLSILFWIPFFAKKKLLTLLHSLVYFFFIVRDIILQLSGANADRDIVKNDMKVFTDSLLLNAAAIAVLVLLSFFMIRNKKA